jgi:hypothetical protein
MGSPVEAGVDQNGATGLALKCQQQGVEARVRLGVNGLDAKAAKRRAEGAGLDGEGAIQAAESQQPALPNRLAPKLSHAPGRMVPSSTRCLIAVEVDLGAAPSSTIRSTALSFIFIPPSAMATADFSSLLRMPGSFWVHDACFPYGSRRTMNGAGLSFGHPQLRIRQAPLPFRIVGLGMKMGQTTAQRDGAVTKWLL